MAWFYLLLAGGLEIVWAFFLKQTAGFTRLGASLITLLALVGSLVFLSLSLRALPLGTAYAIWTGIGGAGTFIVGVVFFGDALSVMRILGVTLIILGVAALKFSS
jgi:quaternary ammonium compound-resistance protein SugE